MVRCLVKRKRGTGVIDSSTSSRTTTTTTTTTSISNIAINSTTRTTTDGAGRSIRIIGCDRYSPTDEISSNSGICSIRDDLEPQSRQSSLLSFFAKAKKVNVKPQPKAKHKNGNGNGNSRSIENSPIEEEEEIAASSLLSSRNSSSSSQSRKSKSKSFTQVYIDCGQSKFGQILCDKCGMLYMPGIVEDENQHKQLCQAYTQGIPCVRGNVKGGKHVDGDDGATVVLWRPSVNFLSNKKPKQQQQQQIENNNYKNYTTNIIITQTQHSKHIPSQWPLLAQMISKDLGTHEETTLDHLTNHIVFLYIGNNNCGAANRNSTSSSTNTTNRCRILGVVTVQLLGQVHAYRMISLHERSLTPVKEAKLGIGLMWTHPVARHRGIATRLVDAARDHAVFGMRVACQDVAFSSPTQAGYDFALRYSNNDNDNDNDNDDNTISFIACNGDGGNKGYKDDKINPEKQQEEDSSCRRRREPLVYEMNL